MSDFFTFTVPLLKSYETVERGEPQYILEGVASDESRDQQAESVIQKGMNFRPLMDYGFINWDHRETPDCLIGEPIHAEIRTGEQGSAEFFVKGLLYVEDKKQAREAWQLAKATERHGSRRKIGWSVQGAITERDRLNPRRILASEVNQLALTHQPVNANTWATIAKSMATGDASALHTEQLDPRLTSVLLGDGDDQELIKALASAIVGLHAKADAQTTLIQRLLQGRKR